MNTNRRLYSTVDYLIDDDFINHVLNGTPYTQKACGSNDRAYIEARNILLAAPDVATEFSTGEIFHLHNRICSTIGLRAKA